MASATKERLKYRFKLLMGGHEHGRTDDGTPNGNLVKAPAGKAVRYKRGDIIETDIDLAKRLGESKFQRLRPDELGEEPQEDEVVQDTFSSMSVKEIRKFADDEELDLGDAKSRPEVLAAVRKAVADSTSE